MRDYSTITLTRHKWENWDCCPEHLRIDLNHHADMINHNQQTAYMSGTRYAQMRHRGIDYMLGLIKKSGLKPIVISGPFMYYAVEDLHCLYEANNKEKP